VNITYRLNYGRNELKELAGELGVAMNFAENMATELPKLRALYNYITNINFDPKEKTEANPIED
jgi:hypothetical protein